VQSPQGVNDLQFAASLASFSQAADLETEADYDRVRFDGLTFADSDASGARFTECAFLGGTGLDAVRLRRARLTDVWFGETRFVAADLAESSLTDVWLSGCVLAGVQAFSLVGRRVLVRGSKLDSVNFRDARLTDVVFEDCVLRDVDFGSAKLLRVRFPGSQLSGLEFTHASCREVDLRGARLGTDEVPGIKGGYDSLGGVRIDHPQLMTLAPLLAHHLGIAVAD